jgi:hypothetical protein
MTRVGGRDRLVRLVRSHAEACGRLGSALYADLLARVADDVAAGGICAQALAGHEQSSGGDAVALRLMGTVHRLVLDRQAPALGLHYPSVGGRPGPPELVWSAFRVTVEEHFEAVRAGLTSPPQTNEVGRSAALLGGLLHLVAQQPLPVRLHEIGASAGLNLRADRFRYDAGGVPAWGSADSPVVLSDAWRGSMPPRSGDLRVVERAGYDIAPVDPATARGRLLLTAYVWPDQLERLHRLRGAVEVAARVPAAMHRTSAGAAVSALAPAAGAWTVLWHSVMWQYVPRAEQQVVTAALVALGAAATPAAPVAHLRLEPEPPAGQDGPRFLVRLRAWPGGDDRLLAEAAPHGLPTTWLPWEPGGRDWRRER